MLTQQQIDEMDKITGLTGTSPQMGRLDELKALRASAPQPKAKENLAEKVANFTGGKILAQGLGQAIANPGIAREQERLLNDSINQQTDLLKKRKEIKEAGGDTTGIDRALQINTENTNKIAEETGTLLNQKGITGKQLAGDVLQLGTTIAGAGTLSKGATLGEKAFTSGLQKGVPSAIGKIAEATTFKAGAKAGAIAGAKTGSIYGASSGVSDALKQDKSAGEIATSGVTGALVGAGTGAALGGLTGGIIGKVKGAKAAKIVKQQEFAEDLVMPKTTPELIEKARKTPGRIQEMGVLGQEKILPSEYDKKNAEIVKEFVSPKFTPQKNIDSIGSEVTKINEGVKEYVKVNKVPFNTNQLNKQLNNGKNDLNLIFASDKQAEKTYNAVTKEFMKHVKSKDTAGLLDARQDFDKIPAIKKLLESEGLGENTKREIVKQVRRSANEYISSLLPKGNKYKDSLLSQTRMIEVMENIIEKNNDRIGRNKIQYLVKKYPWLKTAAYITTTLTVGGIGIGAIGAATGKGE